MTGDEVQGRDSGSWAFPSHVWNQYVAPCLDTIAVFFQIANHDPHLGLDIVRRTAEAAGGALEASSAPSGGARVVVRLPRLTPRE